MARLCPGLYEYYGMQESGTLVVSTPEDRLRRPDSVVKAMMFAEIKIVEADNNSVAPGVACTTDRASSSVWRNFSGVEISGFAAPWRITTLMPTIPNVARP